MTNFSSSKKKNHRFKPQEKNRLLRTHNKNEPPKIKKTHVYIFSRNKVKSQWITNTEKDIEELGITEEDIKRGDPLRDKLQNRVFRLKEERSTNRT